MTRNSTALVLALVAVCAVSAVAAQGAGAATRNFKSEQENTIFSGDKVGGGTEPGLNPGTLKCEESIYGGFQQPKMSETLTLSPTFKECKIDGITATITTNDCSFLLHAEVETAGNVNHPPMLDINCVDADSTHTGPMVISWTIFGTTKCKVTVLEQAGLLTGAKSGLTFTNENKPTTIKMAIHLTEIVYTQDAGSGFAACLSESANNGTLKSETKLEGLDQKTLKQVGILYG
jgi:hypothetical protein